MSKALLTMLAITGKPTRKQLYNAMSSLKEVGVGGVMAYARSGCELQYMSEEWLGTVGNIIAIAEELGLEVWLYDDKNWPSGFCDGRVTENPDFRLKAIETAGEAAGEISQNHSSAKSCFPDLFNPSAVKYFIENTHELYFKHFGRYFGNVIKGIITDEPSIGHFCLGTRIPYYDGLADDYKKLCGGDFFADVKNADEAFYRNSFTAISEKFRSSYFEQICRWCDSHGIYMTGHLMEENDPHQAARKNGDILKNLRTLSLPAIDDVYTDLNAHDLFCLLGIAEHCEHGSGIMSELFATGPTDISFAKRRAMIYLLACFKVDRYLYALSPLDFRGNRIISDYFNPLTADQPDFEGIKLLSAEAEKAANLAHKDFKAQVYVEHPTTLSQITAAEGFDFGKFHDLLKALSFSGINWKLTSEGENPIDAPIIRFTKNNEFILDDVKTADTNEICKLISKNSICREGIFTRRFSDGTTVEIDFHNLTVSVNGEPTNTTATESIFPEFRLKHRNLNTVRAMFINEENRFIINCNDDVAVIFSVRNDASLTLNGEPLRANNPTLLSTGFGDFYGNTATVFLKKGKNTIDGGGDLKYLPSVFLSGDFAYEIKSGIPCEITLSKRIEKCGAGEYFEGFGSVEFTVNITVPEGKTEISVFGTSLFTRVYMDGTLLGECAFAPYCLGLGGKTGEHELKIVQYSSIAPMFGDTKYFNEHSNTVKWATTPQSGKTLFGFEKIGFR